MRIVFMGTPEYSVPTLQKLIDAGHSIEAVFAQPDKPVGRKQVLTPPPTKVFAMQNGIPVYQLNTLRDGEAFGIFEKIRPDIIVVVAYGKILPEDIINLPKYGAINGHASLLPKLRGASPIQWAIVTGERETGVTVMQMDKGMDTGDILAVSKVEILPGETAGELFDRLSAVTADLIVDTLSQIESGTVVARHQDSEAATYAPIINKEMAHIDFSLNAQSISCLIRGFNPWPVAFCFMNNRRIKVYSAVCGDACVAKCGTVVKNDGKLVIACGDNTSIEFLTVQPEGGKIMTAAEMLRGNKTDIGTVVE